MDVDQDLGGPRPRQQGVAEGRILAQPRADGQDQVGVLDPLDQFRVRPEAEVAGIVGAVVGDQVLAAEGQGDRQADALGPVADGGGRLVGPAGTAEHQKRAFGLGQPCADLFDEGGVQGGFRGGHRPDRGRAAVGVQDILGQGDDHGPHPALKRGGKGALDDLDGAFGALDLGGPFGQAAEDLAIVDLLEGTAPAVGQGDLADEQDHRGGVLMRRMHADRGVGRAGAAGDHADAGLAGQLAVSLRHIGGAGFVAAGDDLDPVAHIGEGIEDGEIALAGDAEDAVDAVHDEGVDDAAGGGVGGLAHAGAISRSERGLAMRGHGGEVHHNGHNEGHNGHDGIGDVAGVRAFSAPEGRLRLRRLEADDRGLSLCVGDARGSKEGAALSVAPVPSCPL